MLDNLYHYGFDVLRVLDGDTVEGNLDLGFRLTQKVQVRLAGYDAPETWRPKTEEERAHGKLCTEYIAGLLDGKKIVCHSHKIDLYNRATGILYSVDDEGNVVNINEAMIQFIEENNLGK